jgi:hypothetical protein
MGSQQGIIKGLESCKEGAIGGRGESVCHARHKPRGHAAEEIFSSSKWAAAAAHRICGRFFVRFGWMLLVAGPNRSTKGPSSCLRASINEPFFSLCASFDGWRMLVLGEGGGVGRPVADESDDDDDDRGGGGRAVAAAVVVALTSSSSPLFFAQSKSSQEARRLFGPPVFSWWMSWRKHTPGSQLSVETAAHVVVVRKKSAQRPAAACVSPRRSWDLWWPIRPMGGRRSFGGNHFH